MSQEKVDRYKEQKKNRKKIMAREKRNAVLRRIGATAVCAALAVWVGVSIYQNASKTDATQEVSTKYYTVDTSALDDYLNTLSAD